MASVASGSKLVIHGGPTPVTLRTLHAVDLDGGWSVPVMADLALLQEAGLTGAVVDVEFGTSAGPIRLDAELIQTNNSFILRAPGLRTAALVEQRRENVRGRVRLPLRGKIITESASTRAEVDSAPAPVPEIGADVRGTTNTVSGGGISADITMASWVDAGSRIYVEIEMPNGELAPAVMSVLEHEGQLVRARFVDISPLDRERLVRLVFARQRTELAERRRSADGR